MKINLTGFIILFCFSLSVSNAQTEFYQPNTLDMKLCGGKSNATSFFNLNGKTKFEISDKSLDEDQPERDYIFEYSAYETSLRAEYSPIENLVLLGEIPLLYHSLITRADTIINDTINYKKTTGDYTLLQPSYICLGARYKFYSKLAYMAAMAELRIPPGFHNGIQSDADYKFLSDGAIEVMSGILLGIKFEKGWLESSFSYHFRDEELVDYIKIHTEFGLTTVPGSKLGGQFNFIQSMGNFNEAVEFDPRLTTLQENILQTGFFFQLFITDNWYVDFSYNINLSGKNSLNKSGFLVGAGIRI